MQPIRAIMIWLSEDEFAKAFWYTWLSVAVVYGPIITKAMVKKKCKRQDKPLLKGLAFQIRYAVHSEFQMMVRATYCFV